jgi:hypothetical protein
MDLGKEYAVRFMVTYTLAQLGRDIEVYINRGDG